MLFRHRKSHADEFSGRRIGVVGLGPRNGTTHIAIAISNYLSETGHKRVCLAECNGHNDLDELIRSLGASQKEKWYTYHRVTYIPSFLDRMPMPDIDFDCMVFDLGRDIDNAMNTIRLCDPKIAVAADAPWRRGEYAVLNEIEGKRSGLSGWRVFVNLGNPLLLKKKDDYGMITGCFPFEPDPVFPCHETISFLEEIL